MRASSSGQGQVTDLESQWGQYRVGLFRQVLVDLKNSNTPGALERRLRSL